VNTARKANANEKPTKASAHGNGVEHNGSFVSSLVITIWVSPTAIVDPLTAPCWKSTGARGAIHRMTHSIDVIRDFASKHGRADRRRRIRRRGDARHREPESRGNGASVQPRCIGRRARRASQAKKQETRESEQALRMHEHFPLNVEPSPVLAWPAQVQRKILQTLKGSPESSFEISDRPEEP
jgi:hypothetical protein